MANRIFGIAAILAVMLGPTAARSEDSPSPRSLLGFLKPGMRVGIQTVEGTTNVLIDVYTDEQYGIACDLAALGRRAVAAAKFVDDHPAARKKLDAFIEKLLEKSPDANSDRVIVFPLLRTSFGSICAVGDDCVLMERDGETKRRLVLAKSSIARIDLDAEPLRFAHPSMR
jgi:hypothetical protein